MSRKQEDEHPVTQDAVAGVANPTGVILNDGTGKTGETLKELKEEGLAGASVKGYAERHCRDYSSRLKFTSMVQDSVSAACGIKHPGQLTPFSPLRCRCRSGFQVFKVMIFSETSNDVLKHQVVAPYHVYIGNKFRTRTSARGTGSNTSVQIQSRQQKALNYSKSTASSIARRGAHATPGENKRNP